MSRPSCLALRAVLAEGLEAVGTASGEASTSDEEGGKAVVLGLCRVDATRTGSPALSH